MFRMPRQVLCLTTLPGQQIGLCAFSERGRRNKTEAIPTNQYPKNVLIDGDSDDICHWLPFFCKEVWKVNGEPYTPHTIMQILSGLHRHMREERYNAPNIMDSKMFLALHCLLDALFRELHVKMWESASLLQLYALRKNRSYGRQVSWV